MWIVPEDFDTLIVALWLDVAATSCPPSASISSYNEQVFAWLSNAAMKHFGDCKHTRAQSVISGDDERKCRRISKRDELALGTNVIPQ